MLPWLANCIPISVTLIMYEPGGGGGGGGEYLLVSTPLDIMWSAGHDNRHRNLYIWGGGGAISIAVVIQ